MEVVVVRHDFQDKAACEAIERDKNKMAEFERAFDNALRLGNEDLNTLEKTMWLTNLRESLGIYVLPCGIQGTFFDIFLPLLGF